MAVYEAPGYHKLLFCSDSGINVAPNLEQKKDEYRTFCTRSEIWNTESRVAVLTANEMVDPKVVSPLDAAGLVEAVKNEEDFFHAS